MNPPTRIPLRNTILITLIIVGLATLGVRSRSTALETQAPPSGPGQMVIIRAAGPTAEPARIPPPARFSINGARSATINVNYIGSWDSAARAAFQYAVDIWAGQVNSTVPIVVEAHWDSLGPGILGAAGSKTSYRDFSGAPVANTWYPIALANSLHGSDLNGSTHEITAYFNKDFSAWYFGTDGLTPGNRYDFASVVLHELGHGLGFAGSMLVDDGVYNPVQSNYIECNGVAGAGCWGFGSGYPFIYDRFAENGAGQRLWSSFPNNSAALTAQLQSNNLYFNGTNANAANGSSRPKLYAPATWQQGSSYAHLDEVFNGSPHALMTYSIGQGESIHDPGGVTRGIFQDMGWTFGTQQSPPDLKLVQTVQGGLHLNPGDPVAFVLAVENLGSGGASQVVLSDLLPPGIMSPTWSASPSLAGTTARSGNPYVWDLPDLAAGAAGFVQVTGTIDPNLTAGFAILNAASISAQEDEPNDANNSSAVMVGGEQIYLPAVLSPSQ